MTLIPFPEDPYLLTLGKVIYAVGYLEGLMMFDLPHLEGVPEALNPAALSWRTTRGIATHVQKHLDEVTDPATRAYLDYCSGQLLRIGGFRNDILHSRPATIGGQQRLNRWLISAKRTTSFPITVDHLAEVLADIEAALAGANRLRPPQKPASIRPE